MTAVWLSIGIVAVINFAIKASGPVLLAGRELPDGLLQVIALLAPAILTALVLVDSISEDGRLKVDAQTAGVAVAGVAMGLRVSMLAGIALGVTTAAALRGFL
jgi:branched-subunit amino acid transport protein